MKYYLGRLTINDGVAGRQYASDICIAAANEAQARSLLSDAGREWRHDTPTRDMSGGWLFEDFVGTVIVFPYDVYEVTPATFTEMRKVFRVYGNVDEGDLAKEEAAEQARTLARRIGDQLAKAGTKVPHSKLLHAVAASLGETDWQVLVHRNSPAPAPQAPEQEEAADEPGQKFIPGAGKLFRVPLTVDTTETAFIQVRAKNKREAVEVAREFAAAGHARFEPDEGNYRRSGDFYLGDPDGVESLDESEADEAYVPREGVIGARAGGYQVELEHLADVDEELLSADLTVYDPTEPEPYTEFCVTAFSATDDKEKLRAWCESFVQMLHRKAPKSGEADHRALQHAFYCAMQGGMGEAQLEAIESNFRP